MPNFTLKEIKENISTSRKHAGFTQEEMSKLLNITQPAYSYYETGDNPIPLNKIRKISEILSVPLINLIGYDTNDDNMTNSYNINKNLERIADTLDNLYELLKGRTN